MKYTIELPLPLKGCAQNSHRDWRVRHRAEQQYGGWCEMAFRHAIQTGVLPVTLRTPVTVHLEFYLCRSKVDTGAYFPRDEDNARGAFKAGQDALAAARLVPSDTHRNVRVGTVRLRTKRSEHGGRQVLVVTLEEAEVEACQE